MRWTVGQLAKWILEHRGNGHAFINYSSTDILRDVVQSIERRTLLVVDDGTRITGVATYDRKPGIIFVRNALVSERTALKEMLRWFLTNYRGYSLEASRHLKFKRFKNVEQLTNRI